MKIDTHNSNRIMESQDMLRQIMSEAIGIYMSKEPSKKDSWRGLEMWNLLQHAKHEFAEIERSREPDRFYHNCLDLINLVAMLAARTYELIEYNNRKEKENL